MTLSPYCSCNDSNSSLNVFFWNTTDLETFGVTIMKGSNSLQEQYGDRVIPGYNLKTNEYLELGDEYKIIFFNNPYEMYDHPYHNIKYFDDKDVLTLCTNYGTPVNTYWDAIIPLDFYSILWKFILETEDHIDYYSKRSMIEGSNALLAGYIKMDDLYDEIKRNERVNIIISPHQTVLENTPVSLSNFLRYYDFFLKLPLMYPEINFIFRPHPGLFSGLVFNKIWTQTMVDDYLKKIDAIPNMSYDNANYYLDTFADSDALIHDCGSFIVEYLFTKRPCCFMMKDSGTFTDTLLPFVSKCLENHYKASSEKDILAFIDDVVIKKNDPLKETRESVSRELMVNYPNSSEVVIDYLKKIICHES